MGPDLSLGSLLVPPHADGEIDEVQGFPGGSSGKELAYQCRRLRRC